MLAAFPLATARDRCWWSHWCSLGSPDTSTSFFVRPLKKGQWTCHTHQWSQLPMFESGNCIGGHDIFGILQPQLLWLQNQPVWQSLYRIVALSKSVHNCCVLNKNRIDIGLSVSGRMFAFVLTTVASEPLQVAFVG